MVKQNEHMLSLKADHNDAVAALTSQREALARRLQDQVMKVTGELEAALTERDQLQLALEAEHGEHGEQSRKVRWKRLVP
jgi:hypothetical protein